MVTFQSVIGKVLLAGFLLLFLPGLIPGSGGEGVSEALNVYHTPEKPGSNESLTIGIELGEADNISKVRIFVCASDPFVCFFAERMNFVGNNTYEEVVEFQDVDLAPDADLLYKFKITFEDGGNRGLPDETSLDRYDNVRKVAEGEYYFEADIKEGPSGGDRRSGSGGAAASFDPVMLGFAFGAGMIAFFSPCNYPMLPSYVSYYLGREERETAKDGSGIGRGMAAGAITSLGFLTVFGLVGVAVSFIGNRVIGRYYGPLSVFVGVVIIVLGILILSGANLSLRTSLKAPPRRGFFSFYLFGTGYAIASLACVFPVFIMIVLGSLSTPGLLPGLAVFLAYVVGMAIPMIVVAMAAATLKDMILRRIKRAMPYVKKISAVILIGAGIYLIYLQFDFYSI